MFLGILKKLTPDLEKTLRKAGKKDLPEEYLAKISKYSLFYSIFICIFAVLIISKGIEQTNWPMHSYVFLPIVFLISFIWISMVFIGLNNVTIINRKSTLESDLLYSTRHLLLKLESGAPLLNALIDTSKLETKSGRFFSEIITDVYLGTPIEDAIDIAINDSPSKSFTKLLEEIKNSLRTGTDLEKSMKSTLSSMTKDHMLQITAYGKKLAPLSMMYMIFGTIMPALSSAILVLVIGFVNLGTNTLTTLLVVLIVTLVIIQFFFILFFKALKPEAMS
ncbi:MAG: type II secretion system F family protein [archaeon]